MTPLTDLLQQGTAHAWLFVPTAILLGALHGLEPGHSKTMMAAFIIAVRDNTRAQILEAFVRRIGNDREAEVLTALAQIARIARIRLDQAIAQ